MWKTRHAWRVVVGVDDDNFVLHENHFDINVEVLEKRNVGLNVIRDDPSRAVLRELEEDPPCSANVAKDGTPKLRFVNMPAMSCIASR